MVNALALKTRASICWLTPLAIVLAAGLAMVWLDPVIRALAADQGAAFSAGMEEGGVTGHARAAGSIILWVAAVVLAKPLLLLSLLMAVETWLVPLDKREGRALLWLVQGTFLIAAYGAGLLLIRFVGHPEPLFSLGAAESAMLAALQSGILFLVWILLGDFFQYWAHRAHHRFAFLWRFHSVHHAPRRLDVLQRITHPAEVAANWLLITVPLGFLLGTFDATQFGLLATFFLMQSYFAHTRAPIHFGPIGRVLVDNRYHFIHHSREPRHFDTNFAAVSPIWDMVFGTYCRPEGDRLPDTGLDSHRPAERLSHFLLARLPAEQVDRS